MIDLVYDHALSDVFTGFQIGKHKNMPPSSGNTACSDNSQPYLTWASFELSVMGRGGGGHENPHHNFVVIALMIIS